MSRKFIPSVTALKLIDDQEAFSRLDEGIRARVATRLEWISKIREAAWGVKGEVTEKASKALGLSVPTITREVRKYEEKGWRGLMDHRGGNGKSVPEEFADYVKRLHLQCQRSTTGREVQRMLMERLKLWKQTGDSKHAIPGYDEPPPITASGFPFGWSEDNIRAMRPDKHALTLARQGSKGAAGYLPSILKTRVGLHFGQVVFFDDQDYDVKIAPRGSSQRAIRPQGFNCLDYLSGCFLHHVTRLRWWDKENDQFRTLTQQDFTWFVISFLQRYGYRRDNHGTTFVFEHGTATGYNNRELLTFGGFSNFDEALAAVSHGCIRVERSGLFNQPTFAGMLFRPQSSGNPNFKSPLESMFNLVRNRMAALPGATGRNRDLAPAEQYGVDHYTGQLLKLWDRLDARHRDLIRFPVMTAEEFGDITRTLYEAINARDDHRLEGWEKLGFVAPQFRFTADERSPWLTRAEVADLPDEARALILSRMETPGHMRPHTLSPIEVARAHAGELTKLPDHAIPLLIPTQWARPATVKENRTIAIKDQLLGPEAFEYLCRIEDRDGARVLQPGMKLLCYLNPFAPGRLPVCREDGGFLGTLRLRPRAGFMDQGAILEQLKVRAEVKADLDAEARTHLEPLMRERAEMKRVNDKLANGEPVTPDEIAKARCEAAERGASTRRVNEWTDELPEDMPADLLQPDCTPDAPAISSDQIAEWLND